MYLVLHLDGTQVIAVTGVTSELTWGDPFTLEKTLVKMPAGFFGGRRVFGLVLRHPLAEPGLGYYPLDNAPRMG